ncbi:MAG: hypothetical protein JWN41_100 [Thermoleophilia bacterium]|nr:hypothetical protein [Thermoleophilia bacterium]
MAGCSPRVARIVRREHQMTSATTYAQQTPQQQSGSTDVAAWALVAVVVAAVCAGAGWAIARNASPSHTDVAQTADLAAREAAARGATAGYRSGAASGRAETALRTKLLKQQAADAAQYQGYANGFTDGRSRARARSYGIDGYAGGPVSTYSSLDATDMLASGGLGSDVSGYSDSAFSAYGAGASVSSTSPYSAVPSMLGGTSSGDSYGSGY